MRVKLLYMLLKTRIIEKIEKSKLINILNGANFDKLDNTISVAITNKSFHKCGEAKCRGEVYVPL